MLRQKKKNKIGEKGNGESYSIKESPLREIGDALIMLGDVVDNYSIGKWKQPYWQCDRNS